MYLHHEVANVRILVLGFLSLLFLSCASSARAQSAEINALASDASAAISSKNENLKGSARVLVLDFSNPQGTKSSLGVKLADEFQADFKKVAPNMIAIDRAEYYQRSAQKVDDDDAGCPDPSPDADVTIQGRYQTYPGNVVALSIEVLDDGRLIFKKEITLDLTPEMLSLLSPPEPGPEPESLRGKVAWVNKNRSRDANPIPVRMGKKAESAGYTSPACLYCPNPRFSDESVKAKFHGTVSVDVEIDAEGYPAAISIVKGLPCGLTQQAVEAVAHWRFKPATGPDGKPVSVITEAEVRFRLY